MQDNWLDLYNMREKGERQGHGRSHDLTIFGYVIPNYAYTISFLAYFLMESIFFFATDTIYILALDLIHH